ncbi:MAG: glycerol-3-phosphate 1-O-acyltransferase PlsY [Thermomicrobiales bacterium]|nr:glycerol-3-phosphate 1-O-acyltransferase PlsY [Thermomicrobiales bacterium]
MSSPTLGALLIAIAYLAGSVPWGYLFGRWVGQIDLRQHGSGGTGATNALRTLGWRVSAAVLTLDFLKGFLPVFVANRLGLDGWWVAATGVAAVIGHCWSPFIGFRGGKGMATGAGAAAGMFPAALLAVPVMIAIVAITRYVSLGSILGSVLVSGAVVGLALAGRIHWSIPLAIVAMSAIIVFQHQGNIRRLVSGTERRIGEHSAG